MAIDRPFISASISEKRAMPSAATAKAAEIRVGCASEAMRRP
jgi:hypothetical protein